MRRSILGLVLVAAIAAPASADDKAKAKALYDQGLNHYNLAEYASAIKAWKEAYSLSKKPLLLFNIAQAYRLDGDCKKAMTFYDSYQREEPSPKNQDELDSAVALCAKHGDKPGGTDKPTPPTERPITKPPVADKPAGSSTDVGQLTTNDGNEGNDGNDGEIEDDGGSSGGGLRKIGIGVGVAGVVLGGVGVYFALDASSAAGDLDGYTGEWGQAQIDIEARGERSATLALVTGGLGLAAIVAGGVMFAIGGPKATESSSVAVAPTRGGGAVSWSFRF